MLIKLKQNCQFKRFWSLLHMLAAKAVMYLGIWAVPPEPSLLKTCNVGLKVKAQAKIHASSPTRCVSILIRRMTLGII